MLFCRKDIEKSLKTSSGWDRLVKDAGAAGIRGENCDVLYRDCDIPVIQKEHKDSSIPPNIKYHNNSTRFNAIR